MSHQPNLKNQKGFTLIEGLLIIIIVVLVGFVGYYVYHTNKQTNATFASSAQDANSSPAKATKKTVATTTSNAPTSSQSYVTIKEWNVRAPYSGNLHLSYSIDNNGGNPPVYVASFTSTEVGGGDACVASGGIVERAYSDTVLDDGGTTAGQANSPYTTTKIGNFYYVYIHPQSACTDNNNAVEAQTADAVQTLVKNLQSY